ncbi:MAG TPA: antibiotic biosynthesis monooxygenase family protein [Methylomirabilota bacterium]|nr:antibiotic biosynthesis monooxygenase family protein [Methylomirabilota bacterium]
MQLVILINPFEVPAGEEERFLKAWHEADEHLRRAPGFLSTQLHESLDPQAKFRFINVAQWSPQNTSRQPSVQRRSSRSLRPYLSSPTQLSTG